MKGYRWQCVRCGTESTFQSMFQSISGVGGIPTFIRKIMIPSNWDQTNLTQRCAACNEMTLRITYEFPRKNDPDLIHVLNIVGLVAGDYVPMMWATYFARSHQDTYFDFKYIYKNGALGSSRPAVVTRDNLRELFRLYEQRVGITGFP